MGNFKRDKKLFQKHPTESSNTGARVADALASLAEWEKAWQTWRQVNRNDPNQSAKERLKTETRMYKRHSLIISCQSHSEL